MKKFPLLFVLLFCGSVIQAQYSFNICGFVSSFDPNTPAVNATISGYVTQSNGTTLGQFTANSDSTGNYCSPIFSVTPDTANCAFLSITVSASVPGCNVTQTYTLNEWLCSDTSVYFNISGCDTTTTGCSAYIIDSTNYIGLYLSAWGSGVAPFTYQWTNNNGTIYDTTQTIYPNAYGNYCVTITDATGCVSSACYYYGSNTGNCSVNIYQYSDSSTGGDYLYADFIGGNPVSYQWQGNGTILDTNVIFYPNASGQYCVTVADDSGCTATACYYYGQNTSQCAAYFSSSVDSILCINPPCPVSFYSYAAGTPPFTYYWTFSDGSTDTVENPLHTFVQSNGWDYACLEITDATGCMSSFCDYVYNSGGGTNVNCQASFGGYFYDVNGTPGEVFFSDYSWGANNQVISWSWDFGDGTTSSLQNPSHVFPVTGNYTICLSISDAGGCSSSYCETWYIDTAWWGNNPWGGNGSTCDAQFFAMQDSSVSGMVYLVDLSYGNNLYYTWTFVSSDGTINQTISTQYPFINFTQFGCFGVCLTVTDTLGNCQDSFCDSVCVDSLGNLSKATNWGLTVIPTALPSSLFLSSGPVDSEISSVEIFPNPANSDLNLMISLSEPENVRIELVDFAGRIVSSEDVWFNESHSNHKMDLNRFSDGVYFVKVYSESINYSGKVVKLR